MMTFSIHLDVDVLFGRRFEEFESELVSELFTSLVGNDAFVLHIAFVAYKNNLSVVPRVRFDLGAPVVKEIIDLFCISFSR